MKILRPLIVLVIASVVLGIGGWVYFSNQGKELPNSWVELEWDDLIPEDVPYGEIISDGEIDVENDIWKPGYDENAYQLVHALDETMIRLAGFVVPLEYVGEHVSSFLLVRFYGACTHTPPPPPNQTILVELAKPMAFPDPYQPYWVTGEMRIETFDTELAVVGYRIDALFVQPYHITLPEME